MSTAFFIPDLNGGGAERATLLLSAGWPDHLPNPPVIVRSAAGAYVDLAAELGVEVIDLGLDAHATVSGLRTARRLAQVTLERRIDVLITCLSVQSVLGTRLWHPHLKIIWNVQNPLGRAGVAPGERRSSRVRKRALHRLLGVSTRCVSALTVPSSGLLSSVPSRVPHFAVIPNPVMLPAFEEQRPPAGPAIIGAFGRLVPQKRFDVLIDALALLASDHDLDLQCRIYGVGPLQDELEAQVRRAGIERLVTFAGFRHDVHAAYAETSLVVSSSDYEGFGNVIIEALAAGRPVVATDAPYGARDILGGGRYGVLVPRRDPVALAEGIVSVLPGTELHRELAASARSRAQRYGHRSVAAMYAAFVQEVRDRPAVVR